MAQGDGELLGPAEKRFLLQKLWCHGQLIAPVYGIVLQFFAFKYLSNVALIVCLPAVVVLPCWSYYSWKCMSGEVITPTTMFQLGIGLEFYYGCIAIIIFQHVSESTFAMLIFIATLLEMVETFAYMSVVYCMRESIEASAYDRVMEGA